MPRLSHSLVERKYARTPSPMIKPGLPVEAPRLDVLLVEDDAADARLIQTALKRHPDIGNVAARNLPGRALLELSAGRLQPDLVLLDIIMPRLDGFQFLEVMRRVPAMANVPVVFLTTSAATRDIEKANDNAAFGYIVKPDSYEELEARIGAVIRQAVNGLNGR
jgi:DNA-binding response OmpR family regulator